MDIHAEYDRQGFVALPGFLPREWLDRVVTATDRVLAAASRPDADTRYIDFEPESAGIGHAVQRIKKPHQVDPAYLGLARESMLLDLVEQIVGPNIRLHHSKVNIKAPRVGSPLEWHQDWAFIPHTNRSLAIVSIFLDDCFDENGPMLMMPGSHKGPLMDHHHEGAFYGAIDPGKLDLERAAAVTGPAGTVTIHSPMTIHGSGFNRGRQARRILFYEYAAADAWPLFYGVDYGEFDSRIVRGRPCAEPRLEPVYVKMPYPNAALGAIYAQQRKFEKKFFVA